MAESIVYDFEWDPVKAYANLTKHGVSFEQAATVFLDPLAITVYDAEHSQAEERWITMGQDAVGALLVVVHTFQHTGRIHAKARLISAREATRPERDQYEELPR